MRGVPSDAISVWVTAQPPTGGLLSHTTVGQDGKFSISGLAPGTYEIRASSIGLGDPRFGRATITLDSADATNVDLTLYEPIEIAGTVEVSGGDPRLFRVHLSWVNNSYGKLPFANVNEDGSFRLRSVVPTKYRVSMDPLPETAYVKGIELNGVPVSDETIDIFVGTVPHLKISIGMDGAMISGRVLERDEEESAERTEVVLLADPKAKPEWSISNDAKFSFHGIRPGKYRLIALHRNDVFDPEELFAKGVEIELRPGDRIVKDVTYAK